MKSLMKFILFGIFTLSLINCKGQINKISNTTNISVKKDTIEEIYIGKKYYDGDELNYYEWIKSDQIFSKSDSALLTIYKKIGSNQYILSLEKLIDNYDVKHYEIEDTLNIKSINLALIKTEINGNVITLLYNNLAIKEWNSIKFSHSENVQAIYKSPNCKNKSHSLNNISPVFNFIITITKYKEDAPDVPTELLIEIQNKQNSVIVDKIHFKPECLFSGISDNECASYINKQETKEGIGDYHKFIVADLNFDGKEDFAIINYEGSNAGPQYAYYIQNKIGKFEQSNDLTDNMRFFPVEINNEDKSLKISHPVGCCTINT